MAESASKPLVFLKDYRPPAWLLEHIALEFDLDAIATQVRAQLRLRRNPAVERQPLYLHGEQLKLLRLSMDGRALEANDFIVDEHGLQLPEAGDWVEIQTHVRLNPTANTALQGLYLSGDPHSGFLLTQCESEGFRRITYAPDRPDVMASYRVTLRADRERFPVLLANGNPIETGDLPDGRHYAVFDDPHPKPAYLFALVAGRLENIQEDFVTAQGRKVVLSIFAEGDAIGRCCYAMESLKRAMRWDEQRFGRCYDLDVFNIVATHDFTMGAMENKGLNIFNAKYLLADPQTTTDGEYRHVEAVVAHEYFHNWTGNRVTCRDWFQLCLKEGLTVYREQEFCADQCGPGMRRIEDVQVLKRAQFPEDAGPLAHPVRPAQYAEINNFYTPTIYDKGAEVVRMLAIALGADGFRRGMDLYFERHDGQAVTIEDFLAALGDANGCDLSNYLGWYNQAGTPELRAAWRYDAANRSYALRLAQRTPATAGQPHPKPLPIPLAVCLFAADGAPLPLRLHDEATASGTQRVLTLAGATQEFIFVDIAAEPTISLLRGFSAPVAMQCFYSAQQLALLLAHDSDPFNRWHAAQQFAADVLERERREQRDSDRLRLWTQALLGLFADSRLPPALLAELLMLPNEIALTQDIDNIDPDQLQAARTAIERELAQALGEQIRVRYRTLATAGGNASVDARAQGERALKNRCLQLAWVLDAQSGAALAEEQFYNAANMTDRLAALTCLVHGDAPSAESALRFFHDRHPSDPVVLDKWFAVQATRPHRDSLDRVRSLLDHPRFRWRNPNNVYALIGSFCQRNWVGFHRADGAGYRLLAESVLRLDAVTPQVSARMAAAFNVWQRFEPNRRALMQAQLRELAGHPGLSADVMDILDRALA